MQLTHFKVTNYRNVLDSGWIEVNSITAFVGQNEAGKSNLFEALYRIHPFAPDEAYNIDEDWPVDDWGNKNPAAQVCQAKFALTPEEIEALYDEAALPEPEPAAEGDQAAEDGAAGADEAERDLPTELILIGSRSYNAGPAFAVAKADIAGALDAAKVDAWAKKHAPKFV